MSLSMLEFLAEEYGKALSCHERALFFSSDPTDYSKTLDLRIDPNLVNDQPFTGYALDEIDYILEITALYADAFEMLTKRLADVAKIYSPLQEEIERLKLGADRNQDGFLESTTTVLDRFAVLRENILAYVVLDENEPHRPKSFFKMTWLGMHNICQLIMDEISFTSGRIDSFYNLLNAKKSQDDTKKSLENAEASLKASRQSLSYAVLGIAISVILTLLSITYSVLHDAADIDGDLHAANVQRSEIKKLRNRATGLETILKENNSNP